MTINTERIRALNDAFRTSLQGGKVMLTCGVDALPIGLKGEVLRRVRTFTEFDLANDPHHEHDFGAVEIEGEGYYWKIDTYDKTMDYGSEDAADPDVTTRVLTIMRRSEY